jgi:hypothetical protein
MLKLAMTAAAAVAILFSGVTKQASADEWRHHGYHHHHWHHHHHFVYHWGSGGYLIIRWVYGDCKIWQDLGNAPVGTDWVILRAYLPTPAAAWHSLLWFKARGMCT